MALNEVFEDGDHISAVCSDPATPASGGPVLVGQLPGVALIAETADGLTTLTTKGVYTLSVKAVDTGGNSAVAVGDIIYYQTGDTPKLSKKATGGVRFGYALEAVTSAATATIRVKLGY